MVYDDLPLSAPASRGLMIVQLLLKYESLELPQIDCTPET